MVSRSDLYVLNESTQKELKGKPKDLKGQTVRLKGLLDKLMNGPLVGLCQ